MSILGPSCRDCPDLGFVDIGDGIFVCASCFEARRYACAISNSQIAAPPAVSTVDANSSPESLASTVLNSVVVHEEHDAPALTGVFSLDSTAASSGVAAFSSARITDMNVTTFRTIATSDSVSNSISSAGA
jgi:hypothetical protein